MPEQDKHIYALRQAIDVIDSLALHARAPYVVKYYNFLTRNLTDLMETLRTPPPQPKKTLYDLFSEYLDN